MANSGRRVPQFLIGRVSRLTGPDFCMDGATHQLTSLASLIVRLKARNDQALQQLNDAADGGYQVIAAGYMTWGPECSHFSTYYVQPAEELTKTLAFDGGEEDDSDDAMRQPREPQVVTRPPEGAQLAQVSRIEVVREPGSKRTVIVVTGELTSTGSEIFVVASGPKRHLTYTYMSREGGGGDMMTPWRHVVTLGFWGMTFVSATDDVRVMPSFGGSDIDGDALKALGGDPPFPKEAY